MPSHKQELENNMLDKALMYFSIKFGNNLVAVELQGIQPYIPGLEFNSNEAQALTVVRL